MRGIWVSVLTSAMLAAAGCAGRSTAPAPGSRPEIFSDLERQTCILVRGPVQNRVVPWVDGLTLAQSIVAANYLGANDPRMIILRRDGVPTEVPPAELLAGEDILVAPGDVVEVIP
jgi:hypothetical protein